VALTRALGFVAVAAPPAGQSGGPPQLGHDRVAFRLCPRGPVGVPGPVGGVQFIIQVPQPLLVGHAGGLVEHRVVRC